jgi:hypothetical protein
VSSVAFLSVLCVKAFPADRTAKALTQRTQRKALEKSGEEKSKEEKIFMLLDF